MTKDSHRAPVFRKKDSKHPYFEGYYFKFINDRKEVVILIAGISISSTEKYSFIQVASNYEEDVVLYKFPLTDLKYSEDSFNFKIGNNEFGRNKISISVDDISAEIQLKNGIQWKRSFINPNIMGFLSFVPRVECKHDVITIDTEVTGYIELAKHKIAFKKGDGYIEKNWGSSFPKNYMWLHANQFKNSQLSVQFALAKPKWLFLRPQVYIGYVMNGKIIHYGTHRLSLVRARSDKDCILITINKLNYKILIKVWNNSPVNLIGPKKGVLKSKIAEYLNSNVQLTVMKKKLFKKNEEIIRDTSKLSTTEMHNEK